MVCDLDTWVVTVPLGMYSVEAQLPSIAPLPLPAKHTNTLLVLSSRKW